MRLIKCHIENYGKFSNTDFSFEKDITQFCESNGFGKTTLASFIKAMFYGLPTAKRNSTDFNDRQRFYPFGGGKFGGNLVFETGGKEYRIERFFDRKSETRDECAVFYNDAPYGGLGEDIGRAVFGLDKDSFERTAFITSEGIEVLATGSINAKLNNFVDDTVDGVSFDDAYETLINTVKKYKAVRGNNDFISKKQTEITQIKHDISNIESIESGLENLYSQSAVLKDEIRGLEKRRDGAEDINRLIERWEVYDRAVAGKGADERELAELMQRYPQGIPSAEQISAMKKSSNEIIELTGSKRAAGFDARKSQRLEELSRKFPQGIPDGAEQQTLQDQIDCIKELELKIKAAQSVQRSERETKLDRNFGGRVPSGGEVEKFAAKTERYRSLDRELKAADQPAAQSAGANKRGKLFAIAAIVAVIVAAAGVGLLFVNAIAGGVILGAGAAGLIAVGFLYLKNANSRQPVRANENAIKIQAEMKGLEEEVREFLVPYSYYSKNGIVYDFAVFCDDLKEYERIKQATAQSEEELKEMRGKLSALTQSVNFVFSKYGLTDGDLQKNFTALQTAAAEYISLCKDKENAERDGQFIESRLKELYSGIAGEYAAYKLALPENIPQGLEELERHSAKAKELKKRIADADAESKEYAKKYNLTVRPQACAEDVEEIKRTISEKQSENAALERKIDEDESRVELLDDKTRELESAEELLEDYKKRHKILSAAAEMLKTAENNLKEKYVSPVKEKFLEFADTIESALGEKVSLDRNFGVTFERGGETRSDRHLSAGQRSICALCMRIALIDNMFGGEKPFIVMDDPFVNLDGAHMQKTAQAVRELAKDRQIIYFCCHESRTI